MSELKERAQNALPIGIVICSLLTASVLFFVWNTSQTRSTITFFSTALEQEPLSEKITVNNEVYTVSRGVVYRNDSPVEGREALQALAIAYAKTVARKNPIIGLPGVDLEAFSNNIPILKRSVESLASIQEDTDHAQGIKEALYPVTFIETLHRAEHARREFLTSGSETDMQIYHKAIYATLQAARNDTLKFKESFAKVAPEKRFVFANKNVVTRSSMLNAIQETLEAIAYNEERLLSLEKCTRYTVKRCDITEIMRPEPPNMPPMERRVDQYAFFEDIRALHASGGRESILANPIVALAKSACISSTNYLPSHYFGLRSPSDEVPFSQLMFLNNIEFNRPSLDQDRENSMYYFLAKQELSYAPLPHPTSYYMCPEIGKDMGTVLAIKKLAELQPLMLDFRSERSDILYEEDATEYLRLFFDDIPDDVSSSLLESMMETELAMRYHTMGYEDIVGQIGNYGLQHVRMNEKQPLVDVSAEYLFVARSAFPTLLLLHSPAMTPDPISIFIDTSMSTFYTARFRYSDLKNTVPREELVESILMTQDIHHNSSDYIE